MTSSTFPSSFSFPARAFICCIPFYVCVFLVEVMQLGIEERQAKILMICDNFINDVIINKSYNKIR